MDALRCFVFAIFLYFFAIHFEKSVHVDICFNVRVQPVSSDICYAGAYFQGFYNKGRN